MTFRTYWAIRPVTPTHIGGCACRAAMPLVPHMSSNLWALIDDGADGVGGDTDTTVKASKIKISAPSKKLAAGKKVQLTAKITPKNVTIKKVSQKSDNKKYDTVNAKGIVTTKKAGKGKTVTITATSTDSTDKI